MGMDACCDIAYGTWIDPMFLSCIDFDDPGNQYIGPMDYEDMFNVYDEYMDYCFIGLILKHYDWSDWGDRSQLNLDELINQNWMELNAKYFRAIDALTDLGKLSEDAMPMPQLYCIPYYW